jgi:hypothetical protein
MHMPRSADPPPPNIRSMTARDSTYTVDQLRAYLKRYSTADVLQLINRHSTELMLEQRPGQPPGVKMVHGFAMTEWDLSIVAKLMILWSNDYRGRLMSMEQPRALLHALGMVQGLPDPTFGGEHGVTMGRFRSFMTRTAYLQFPAQLFSIWELVRPYVLFEEMWEEISTGLDIKQTTAAVLGRRVREFMALSFAVFSMAARDDGAVFRDSILEDISDPNLQHLGALATEERRRHLWRLIATDYRGFRNL